MIVELKKNKYVRIRPLVNPLKFHLAIDAIIDAAIPGRIWVDNENDPRSALIWDLRYSYYLAGREDNYEFNIDLRKLFTKEIAPTALVRGIKQYFLVCSEAWKTVIMDKELITEKSYLRTIPRCYYVLKTYRRGDWKQPLPPSFQMKFIDNQLLRNKTFKNLNSLIIEIKDIAGSTEEFLRKGNFGYCLLSSELEILSWCLSFVHGHSCEAWVQTIETHQKKGFATLTVASFVDYCQNNNLTIGWHSTKANQGSIRLAEKLGFERTSEEYFWVFGDHEA